MSKEEHPLTRIFAAIDGHDEHVNGRRVITRDPNKPVIQASDPNARQWIAAMLRESCDEMARAEEGNRNQTLYAKGFRLGTFVHGGYLDEFDGVAALTDAAERTGLPSGEIERTIRSAFDDAAEAPAVLQLDDRPPVADAFMLDDAERRCAAVELDAFLSSDIPPYDWLVPSLLERMDRVILTGPEGGGKSTLLRQFGVQLASGVHPFDGLPFLPVRVLLLDLENTERQSMNKIRSIRSAAGDEYAGGMWLLLRPEGVDLTSKHDAAWLWGVMDEVRPDALLLGPLYKLASGNPNDEEVAQRIRAVLDKIRVHFGCAIVLEAHTPHATNGQRRPERPYGASLWLRWPEFGIYLDPETGAVRHWRGQRDERDWPPALHRGQRWPWEPVELALMPASDQEWLMEQMSRYVEEHPDCTQNMIRDVLRVKKERVRDAARELVIGGYLDIEANPGRTGSRHRSLRPYRVNRSRASLEDPPEQS